VLPRFPLILALCAVAAADVPLCASAAGPPLPASPPVGVPLVPDPAQARVQTQLMIQQAQAQAQLAASEARVQAELNANQARLEGQLAAQEAGTQAQLPAARAGIEAAGPPAQLSPSIGGPIQEPWRAPAGTLELIALTPQLGWYFGTDHGVLVVRAATHGVLKLQDGDVILSIGGRVPASGSQAIRILTSYDPGEKIGLVILREHRRMSITATLPAQAAF
jgi:S1-C subfamily serine protease